MFSALVMLIVISLEIYQTQSSPISFKVDETISEFIPRITDRVGYELLHNTDKIHLKVKDRKIRRKSERSFHKSKGLIDEDRIKFIDKDNGTLEEGSLCRRSEDGVSGYCLLSTQCRHVMEEFKMFGIKIDICGYDGSMPLVCCPLGARQKKIRQRKRLSARYCDEYSELGKSRGSFLRLTSNPVVVESEATMQCNSPVPLIVGGESALPGEFPHMAAIGWTKNDQSIRWSCGGSLISDKFILTAAHCGQIAGKPPNVVRLGAQDLKSINTKTTGSNDYQIKKILQHPLYDSNSYYHDIALIQLKISVKFTQFIRPACLWQSSNLDVRKATATGWGRLGFHGRKAKDLQKVDLNIIERRACNHSFEGQGELYAGILSSQICAGQMEGGKDTCQGDSGGPLQVTLPNNRCVYQIIGITSFGKFCAAPNMPGVYTNVYSYLEWIEDNVFRIVV